MEGRGEGRSGREVWSFRFGLEDGDWEDLVCRVRGGKVLGFFVSLFFFRGFR